MLDYNGDELSHKHVNNSYTKIGCLQINLELKYNTLKLLDARRKHNSHKAMSALMTTIFVFMSEIEYAFVVF